MTHLQGRLKSDLDEKDGVIHTGIEAAHESTLEIDLTKYHEERAGSLVLDPKCVCFLLLSLVRLADCPHATVRHALNSEIRSHRA
jgi:hypothetical protein